MTRHHNNSVGRSGRIYSAYMMESLSGTLYTGVTGDLNQRVWMHKTLRYRGFSQKYRCTKLVYFWQSDYVMNAIRKEKQLKGWTRAKKLTLIERQNPAHHDLAAGWYEQDPLTVEGPLEYE